MNMPTSPTRGRTCQTPQPLSPSSRRLIRTWRWSPGREQHPLEPHAGVLAAALALLEQRPGLGHARRRARRAAARARRALRTRGPRSTGTAVSIPPSGIESTTAQDRRCSRRAICARSSAARRGLVGRGGANVGGSFPRGDIEHGHGTSPARSLLRQTGGERLLARPQRLLDVDRRDARDPHRDEPQARRSAGPAPPRGRARRTAPRAARASSASTICPARSGRARRPPPGARPASAGRSPGSPVTAAAANALTGTPVSSSASSSASASGPRLRWPPSTSRASAASSTGVRVLSGSMPMWRKNTR